jgi:transposase
MLTIGVDAHTQQHTAVALDALGKVVDQRDVPNTPDGWTALVEWAHALAPIRQWGIEGAWNYGRNLAQHLVDAGETVYDVNPRWTAAERRRARRPGKNDRLDAEAIARWVLREAAGLTPVALEDATVELDLLSTEREAAVREATRLRNQIHAQLRQIDPLYRTTLPALTTAAGVRAARQFTTASPKPTDRLRAAMVIRLAERLQTTQAHIDELTAQIEARTAGLSPLMAICGIKGVRAGALVGILGPGARFGSDAQLAAYAGVAPLVTGSAGSERHRLNRGGNRRLNALVHQITAVQVRAFAPAQAYLARRMATGKTKKEAFRALKRFIVRAIWRAWLLCLAPRSPATTMSVLLYAA